MTELNHNGTEEVHSPEDTEPLELDPEVEELLSGVVLDIDDDETAQALDEAMEDLARLQDEDAVSANSEGSSILSELPEDAVTLYFTQIGDVPLLTAEEESELAQFMEAGQAAKRKLADNENLHPDEIAELESQVIDGEMARQHFIEANTRLVVSVAKRYRNYGLPFQDLIQAGNIGLIRAVDKFDYHMGNRFSTYAMWWIRQAIKRSLTQQGYTIRLPYYLRSRLRRIRALTQRLEKQLGRQPNVDEIAEALGEENIDRLRQLLQISKHTVSLNTLVGEEGESELLNLIADEETPSPAESVQSRLMAEDLNMVMHEVLNRREIEVLSQRFGLKDHEQHTLQELADELGVSRERVRQIERKALRKLRHPLHRRKLLAYLK